MTSHAPAANGPPAGLRKPISAVSNSPPPPPHSVLRLLLRRRRRSDLLLAAIGALICLVSGFHIALHSRHAHVLHGPGAGAGHAVRGRLDGFQDGAGMLSRRMERMRRAVGRGARRGEVEAEEGTGLRGDKRGETPGSVARNVTADGPRPGAKSKTTKIANEPPVEQSTGSKSAGKIAVEPPDGQSKANPQAKENADRPKKAAKKADASPPGVPPDGPAPHPVAHLSCHDHGGPSDRKIVDEMVFWSDVPSDADYLSPMHPTVDPRTDSSVERYLTFEPDHGGWNNIRMAMETALVMGHATGRTLVLPPEQRMYLIDKGVGDQRASFGFNDFFHLDAISIEHRGFKVITMDEFLAREGVTGRLQDYATNMTMYPPQNKTDYGVGDGRGNQKGLTPLWKYLRRVGNTPTWDPWECALAIPSSTDDSAVAELKDTVESVMAGKYGGKPKPTPEEFNGKPVPVDAPPDDKRIPRLRLRVNVAQEPHHVDVAIGSGAVQEWSAPALRNGPIRLGLDQNLDNVAVSSFGGKEKGGATQPLPLRRHRCLKRHCRRICRRICRRCRRHRRRRRRRRCGVHGS